MPRHENASQRQLRGVESKRTTSGAKTTTASEAKTSLVDLWRLLKAASVDGETTKADIAVLMVVLDRLGENESSWPGLVTIAKDARSNERTVMRSINRLCEHGYLVRESKPGRANRYRAGSRARADSTGVQTGTDTQTGTDIQTRAVLTPRPVPVLTPRPVELTTLNWPQESTSKEPSANSDEFALSADESKPRKRSAQRKQDDDDQVCKLVLDAYHAALPSCTRHRTVSAELRKSILRAQRTAKAQIASGAWPFREYEAKRFWSSFFSTCADDAWLRGDLPNPKQPSWRQTLAIILREDRFAGIVDGAIDQFERDARGEQRQRPTRKPSVTDEDELPESLRSDADLPKERTTP